MRLTFIILLLGVSSVLQAQVVLGLFVSLVSILLLGRWLNHRLAGSFFKYVYTGLLLIGSFLIFNALNK